MGRVEANPGRVEVLLLQDSRGLNQSRETLSYAGGIGAYKEAQSVFLAQVDGKYNAPREHKAAACGIIRLVKVEYCSLAVFGRQ
jgi:hypothetical protein